MVRSRPVACQRPARDEHFRRDRAWDLHRRPGVLRVSRDSHGDCSGAPGHRHHRHPHSLSHPGDGRPSKPTAAALGSLGRSGHRVPEAAREPHAVDDRNRHLLLLVPRRAVADGAASPRRNHPPRRRSGCDAALYRDGHRHRDGQPGGRPAVGQSHRTGPCAAGFVWPGPVRAPPGSSGTVVLVVSGGLGGPGIFGRTLRRAPERASAASRAARRKGSHPRDRKCSADRGYPAGVGLPLVAGHLPEPVDDRGVPRDRPTDTGRILLRAGHVAGLLHQVHALAADPHDLPNHCGRTEARPSRRPRPAHLQSRLNGGRPARGLLCGPLRALHDARSVFQSAGNSPGGQPDACDPSHGR